MSAPRKVLFISADQWRGECLSALGHPTVKTPHLDALIADSVLFKRHYTVTAPCGPARASLNTGLYLMNHRSGRNGTPLLPWKRARSAWIRPCWAIPIPAPIPAAGIRTTRRSRPMKAHCPAISLP
ncbi:MAG: sulfatase-like hydrolase/transferase [Rhodospirillaceae bacterium]|nr:sulfatase-like hydrolase/transferase [Rhodospirillaceae bacterium]